MANVLFLSESTPPKLPKLHEQYVLVPVTNKYFSFVDLSKLYHLYAPVAILTYGTFQYMKFDMCAAISNITEHFGDTVPEYFDVASLAVRAIKADTKPLVSFVTTTYNPPPDALIAPIKSVLQQTYSNWEWIIWDDSELIDTYKGLLDLEQRDLRIRIYKGMYHTGNHAEMTRRGFDSARGTYIVPLSQTGSVDERFAEQLVAAGAAYPDAGMFYANKGDGTSSADTIDTLKTLNVCAWRTSTYAAAGKHDPALYTSAETNVRVHAAGNGASICRLADATYTSVDTVLGPALNLDVHLAAKWEVAFKPVAIRSHA